MKNAVQIFILSLLLAIMISGCVGEAHVKYRVHTTVKGTYSLNCPSAELRNQMDEQFEVIGRYIEGVDLNDVGTTITFQGETEGTYEIRENGRVVSEGEWESYGESEIELWLDDECLILEVERVAGKIQIIAEEAYDWLCPSKSGDIDYERDDEGFLPYQVLRFV